MSCFSRMTSMGVPRASRSALYMGMSKSASSMCVTCAPDAVAMRVTTCASLRLYEPARVLPAKTRSFMVPSLHHRGISLRLRSLRPQESSRHQAGEDRVGGNAHREVDGCMGEESGKADAAQRGEHRFAVEGAL